MALLPLGGAAGGVEAIIINQLPDYLYITFVFVCALGTFYYSIEYFRGGKSLFAVGLLLFGVSATCIAVLRAIDENLIRHVQYHRIINIVAIVSQVTGFIFAIMVGCKESGDKPGIRSALIVTLVTLILVIVAGTVILNTIKN